MVERIETGVHGIAIELDGQGGGMITSDLHDQRDGPGLSGAWDAVESLVLAHACAGIDIRDPAYLEGIETSVEAILHHLETDKDEAAASQPENNP